MNSNLTKVRAAMPKTELARLMGIHRNTLAAWIRPIEHRLSMQTGYKPRAKTLNGMQIKIICAHICYPFEEVFKALGYPEQFIREHQAKEIVL